MNEILHKDSLFFENLFRQYYKSLKSYAFKFVNDIDAADDIVQDVFFELWLKRKDLDIQQFKSYLFKAVSNRSINFLKTKKENIPLDVTDWQQEEFYLHSLVTATDDYALLNELNDEIKSCIDKLPDQCRRIFLLRHTYNLKNREIAEQLNISVKAVEKQISKALFEIRSHLQKLDLLPFAVSVIVKLLAD